MVDDPVGRFSRWSRRKVRAKGESLPDSREEDRAAEISRQAEEEARHKPGRMITDAPVNPAVGPDLSLDHVTIDDHGQEVIAIDDEDSSSNDDDENAPVSEETAAQDFTDVDFEALTIESDYTRFMGKNVPEHIREKALAKLWTSSPLFAEFDGLNDYDEDFTDAKWVVKNLRTDYKVGRGFQSDEDLAKWEELGADSKKRSEEEQRQRLAVATIKIAAESPDQPEIVAFFDASERYHSALYPVDSNHFTAILELMVPHIRFLVARENDTIVGCGALVLGNEDVGEIKRMWVDPEARGKGVGCKLVGALEELARIENVSVLHLETGNKQPDAQRLYERCGFTECEAFGGYEPDPLSIFMEKKLG